jgi:hypothetical protein
MNHSGYQNKKESSEMQVGSTWVIPHLPIGWPVACVLNKQKF